MQDTTGIVALKKVLEMKKIELDYLSPRDTKFQVTLADHGVVVPRDLLEGGTSQEAPSPLRLPPTTNARAGFQFVGGRIRLR